MSEFFKWLASNSIAANALIIAFGILVISVNSIFIFAFFQGREISFWPPKIGIKPDNPKEKLQSKGSSSMVDVSLELADIRARLYFEDRIVTELSKDIVKGIIALFSVRDEAVTNNDRHKFLGTQLGDKEIHYGSSKGYINNQAMKTSVLRISPVRWKSDEDMNVDYVVLVRENYVNNDKHTHSGYLGYEISRTNEGLRIVANRNIIE